MHSTADNPQAKTGSSLRWARGVFGVLALGNAVCFGALWVAEYPWPLSLVFAAHLVIFATLASACADVESQEGDG